MMGSEGLRRVVEDASMSRSKIRESQNPQLAIVQIYILLNTHRIASDSVITTSREIFRAVQYCQISISSLPQPGLTQREMLDSYM
jgi:hypothetical protein